MRIRTIRQLRVVAKNRNLHLSEEVIELIRGFEVEAFNAGYDMAQIQRNVRKSYGSLTNR